MAVYTTNGEMLSKSEADSAISYEYDELGNLLAVQLHDGISIDYVVDGRNRRIGCWVVRSSRLARPFRELVAAPSRWHGVSQRIKMSELLIELHLGNVGLRFVKLHLNGGGALSHSVLERVDLDSGEVVTHLPKETSLEEAEKFEHGGRLHRPERTEGATMIPVPSTRDHLVAVITRHLSASEKVCIMENANAGRDDAWLKRSSANALFFGDEVYHLLSGPSSAPAINATVRAAQSLFTFVGVMTSLPKTEQLPDDRGELTLSTLQRLAERSEQIFVGAYDGEGYLLWRRSSLAPGNLP